MPATREPTLVLFPGLGIDERLFSPQREICPLEVPAWLEPNAGESVADYSRRMAGTVVSRPPYFFGGVSFGAMVALEAARHLPASGVFLIAGSRSGRDVSHLLRPMGRAAPLLPEAAFEHLRPFVRLTLAMLGEPVTGAQIKVFEAMFAASSPRLVRWGLEAVMDWEFAGPDPAPVHQVHGTRDKMIPISRVRPDLRVPGGGHVINVTHAKVVNQFIREKMASQIAANPVRNAVRR